MAARGFHTDGARGPSLTEEQTQAYSVTQSAKDERETLEPPESTTRCHTKESGGTTQDGGTWWTADAPQRSGKNNFLPTILHLAKFLINLRGSKDVFKHTKNKNSNIKPFLRKPMEDATPPNESKPREMKWEPDFPTRMRKVPKQESSAWRQQSQLEGTMARRGHGGNRLVSPPGVGPVTQSVRPA